MTFNYTCFVNKPTHISKYITGANTNTVEVLFSLPALSALNRGFA